MAFMSRSLRLILCTGILALCASPAASQPSKDDNAPGNLPFAPAPAAQDERYVIATYFPSFPLTIAPLTPTGQFAVPAAADYYETQFLQAEGVHGRFAAAGGFMQERPLLPPGGVSAPLEGYAIEIRRAQQIGIDAFGVDLLDLDGRHWATALALLHVADPMGGTFRIVAEPDLVTLAAVSVDTLCASLLQFAAHPSAFRLRDHRLLVIPYAAERKPRAFYEQLASCMAKRGEPIALVPGFAGPGSRTGLADISWAASEWGEHSSESGATQKKYAAVFRGAGYPRWFASATPQDVRPKRRLFYEAQGSGALANAFEAAIAAHADGLHLITWNDYSEGTEFAPGSLTRHAFYDLTAWYIAWFRTGRPPAIERDGFLVFHRRQLLPTRSDASWHLWTRWGTVPAVDIVDVRLFLTAPAVATVTLGGETTRRSFPAGASRMMVPARLGAVTVQVARGGHAVAYCRSPWRIAAADDRFAPLYAGFSSLRNCN